MKLASKILSIVLGLFVVGIIIQALLPTTLYAFGNVSTGIAVVDTLFQTNMPLLIGICIMVMVLMFIFKAISSSSEQ